MNSKKKELYRNKKKKRKKRSTFKKNRELKEHANLAAEAEDIQIADIMTVQEDRGGRWLPETVESPEKRGFATSAGAYDPHDDTRWDFQAQLVQNRSSGIRQLGQVLYPKFHLGFLLFNSIFHHQQMLCNLYRFLLCQIPKQPKHYKPK